MSTVEAAPTKLSPMPTVDATEQLKAKLTDLAHRAHRLPAPPVRTWIGNTSYEVPLGEYLTYHQQIDRLLDTLTKDTKDTT